MNPKNSHDPPKVLTAECPLCAKDLSIIQFPEKIPLFGQIIIQTIACSHCGFKFSDVMSVDFKEPCGFEAKIENAKDLDTKLVRNSSGTIEIPELGVLLEPGPMAEGFYTNIEGLLERVENVLNLILQTGEADQKVAAKERMEQLHQHKQGKLPFHVKILDPFGGSALIGNKVRRFVLTQAEADELKRSVFVVGDAA